MSRTGLLDVWRASEGASGGRRWYLVALAAMVLAIWWAAC